MQVKYGSYAFNADDVSITHIRRMMRSETGLKTGYIDTWTLNFRLRGDDQSALTTEVIDLYAAFAVDGRDLVLLQNDGANSAFITRSGSTTSGTRVQEVSFPILADGQYSYFIDGSVMIDAETVTNVDANLFYSETLSIRGNGGPQIVVLPTATGTPIKQTTRQRTPVTGIQTGTARAYGAYPQSPIILFPNLLINESVEESRTVSFEGGKDVYTLSWSYPYQHNQYFSGLPQLRL